MAKRRFKIRYIVILIIILGVAGYAAAQYFGFGEKPVEYDTVKAAKGDIIQTVDATGTVKALAEVDLAFESVGTLASTTVEVGDFVTRGQILAELDNQSLKYEVDQAVATLDLAKANLNLKVAGETSQAINISRADVDKARASLDNAEVNLDKAELDLENAKVSTQDQVDQAELSLESAKNKLDSKQAAYGNAEDSTAESLEDTFEDTVVVLESAISSMSTAISDMDNILGIDDPSANDVFEKYLSVLNSVALLDAKTDYNWAKDKKSAAQVVINELSINSSHDDIINGIDVGLDALEQIHRALTGTRIVLDNTITGADLTLAELNLKKTTIDTDLSTINAKQSSVLTQEQAIETLDITNESSLNTAEEALEAAQDAYESALKNLETVQNSTAITLSSYEAAVDGAQASVKIQKAGIDATEAALDLKEASPRAVDLAPLQAQVQSAEAVYNLAVYRLDKSQIKSPANGMIIKINYDIGEQTSTSMTAGNTVMVLLATDLFNVEVDIPETDIVKISVGDAAEITLDAFGEEAIFVGSVIEIEPAETVIQDVVYYRVKVKIEFSTEQPVKNGMTANVIIKTEEKKGALVIPQRAVIIKNGQKVVRILENGKVVEKEPVLGLRGDEGLIEIVSGINEGEEVITAIREE